MNAKVERNPSVIGTRKKIISAELAVNNVLLLALIVLCGYFTIQSSSFFHLSNFTVLLTNYAAIGIVAAVMSLLVIAGRVDLSIGSNIALSGMVTALAIANWHWSPVAGIACGVATGTVIGFVLGILCTYCKFNPIIASLGMLSVLRGVTLLINPTEVTGLGDGFSLLGNGSTFGVPNLLLISLGIFAASGIFLATTVWGRYVFAVGINPQAAHLAALPVKRLFMSLHIATGAAAGLAGVVLVSRLDGASPGSLGLQMELQALTIILLGGVAFAGGRGRIFGVLIAWIFLAVLDNGLTLLNVPPFVQLVASGAALVLAASLDALGTALGPRLEERRRVRNQIEKS